MMEVIMKVVGVRSEVKQERSVIAKETKEEKKEVLARREKEEKKEVKVTKNG